MSKAPTFVIAEAGVNHNGDRDIAFKLVEVAVAAGADAVKFQTFKADRLASRRAPKAAYQEETTGTAETQLEMLRRLELSHAMHLALRDHCNDLGIEFMSTPFDEASADFLANDVGVRRLKIPSGEITNGPFLLHVARLGLPLIMSTGMSTLYEVREALGVIAFGSSGSADTPSREAFAAALALPTDLSDRVTLLHCTTQYPTPHEDVNLRAMDTLRDAFGVPVGFSDHTPGISAPLAAVARRAVVVEKHFTLGREMPGPDHRASLEPDELEAMVRGIREVEAALGSREKAPAPSEQANIEIARKSVIAARHIAAGETLDGAALTTKRPATGASPMTWWSLLGTEATRDYEADEPIDPPADDGA